MGFPCRLKKDAGYRRDWTLRGSHDDEIVGEQTITRLYRPENPDDAHDMTGIMIPLQTACPMLSDWIKVC